MSCVKLFPKHTGILRHHVPQKSFSTAARQRAGEVRIVEVGPRDGLQNEKNSIPLKTKIELIRRLAQTGVRSIEAGAFVAPKWVPQVSSYLCFGYPNNTHSHLLKGSCHH